MPFIEPALSLDISPSTHEVAINPSFPSLPLEIWDIITEELKEDKATLKSCALVSRMLTHLARQHLFKDLELIHWLKHKDDKDVLLNPNCYFLGLVRSIVVEVNGMNGPCGAEAFDHFAEHLDRLTAVKYLCIDGQWDTEPLDRLMANKMFLKPVETLQMFNFMRFNTKVARFISAFPSLKRLDHFLTSNPKEPISDVSTEIPTFNAPSGLAHLRVNSVPHPLCAYTLYTLSPSGWQWLMSSSIALQTFLLCTIPDDQEEQRSLSEFIDSQSGKLEIMHVCAFGLGYDIEYIISILHKLPSFTALHTLKLSSLLHWYILDDGFASPSSQNQTFLDIVKSLPSRLQKLEADLALRWSKGRDWWPFMVSKNEEMYTIWHEVDDVLCRRPSHLLPQVTIYRWGIDMNNKEELDKLSQFERTLLPQFLRLGVLKFELRKNGTKYDEHFLP